MAIEAIHFTYDTGAVSQKQFDEHITLYKGYIKKTNEISDLLLINAKRVDSNAIYSHYRALKKEQTFALDGVILHEAYFKNMTDKKCRPGPNTMALLEQFYGGYDNWKSDFIACAKSARGWCLTAYDQRMRALTTFLQDAHDQGPVTMAYPMIVLDMYEHAYFTDYGTDKETYINRFIDSINWHVVEAKAAKIMAACK